MLPAPPSVLLLPLLLWWPVVAQIIKGDLQSCVLLLDAALKGRSLSNAVACFLCHLKIHVFLHQWFSRANCVWGLGCKTASVKENSKADPNIKPGWVSVLAPCKFCCTSWKQFLKEHFIQPKEKQRVYLLTSCAETCLCLHSLLLLRDSDKPRHYWVCCFGEWCSVFRPVRSDLEMTAQQCV